MGRRCDSRCSWLAVCMRDVNDFNAAKGEHLPAGRVPFYELDQVSDGKFMAVGAL